MKQLLHSIQTLYLGRSPFSKILNYRWLIPSLIVYGLHMLIALVTVFALQHLLPDSYMDCEDVVNAVYLRIAFLVLSSVVTLGHLGWLLFWWSPLFKAAKSSFTPSPQIETLAGLGLFLNLACYLSLSCYLTYQFFDILGSSIVSVVKIAPNCWI